MGNKQIKKNKKIKRRTDEDAIEKVAKKEYKIIFIGESGIGAKTTLINRIMDIDFNDNIESTIKVNSFTKEVNVDNNKKLTLFIYDTPGGDLKTLVNWFLKDVDAVVLGYDITDKTTFEEIEHYWYPKIKDNKLVYLIGNKIDLNDRRIVKKNIASNFAKAKKLKFFEISCKTKEGLDDFYKDLINNLLELE